MTDAVPPPTAHDADEFAFDLSRLQVVDAHQVSQENLEAARKISSNILQKLNEETATQVAKRMGVDDAAISRWKAKGGLAFASRLLACAGMKVVPADAIVYIQPDQYKK